MPTLTSSSDFLLSGDGGRRGNANVSQRLQSMHVKQCFKERSRGHSGTSGILILQLERSRGHSGTSGILILQLERSRGHSGTARILILQLERSPGHSGTAGMLIMQVKRRGGVLVLQGY